MIHYDREDKEGPKQSNVNLLYLTSNSSIKDILTKSLGVLVVVDKKREIYFIDNVKFHIDAVAELGSFVEIEAIDKDVSIGKEKLREQCQQFLDLFGVKNENLISKSYSDMLLKRE